MQRLTVSEAGKTLGVSAQAVLGRIKRKTIEHEVGLDKMCLLMEVHQESCDKYCN
jgi:hypothetical protein